MNMNMMLISRDLEKTKAFYKQLFNMRVIVDFGANITLTGGLSFQTLETWCDFIHQDISSIQFGGNNAEIYIELEDLDGFMERCVEANVTFVHPIQTHDWGQRGLRVYDPDMHIIEVSEPLVTVVMRFHNQGLSIQDIAKHMGLSEKMTQRFLKKAL